ncbi:hypothetical protein PG990_012300 [Apiospora arundinis]
MPIPSEPTIDSWAAAQKQAALPPTDEQLDALSNLFSSTTSNPEELSEIASRVAKPHIKAWEECNVEALWFIIQDAVDKLPSQNDKLAALVIALQRLPDGKGVMHGPEHQDPAFIDLPLFNNHWTEWVDMSFGDLGEKHPERESNRRAWVNQNAFLAKITAQAGDVKLLLDQRSRGGSLLRWALERTPWDESSPTYQPPYPPMDTEDAIIIGGDSDSDEEEDEGEDGKGEDGNEEDDGDEEAEEDDDDDEMMPNDKITVLDALVPAAAQWIKYCPQQMYEMAAAGGEMGGEYETNGTNFGTKMGYSLERWAYWRKRFEEMSTMEELEDGTRCAAKESMERMDAISKEGSRQ